MTVRSTDPADRDVMAATVIHGWDDVVTFADREDAGSVIEGLTITGGSTGILCYGASPTVRRCAITANGQTGMQLMDQSNPTLIACEVTANEGPGISMLAAKAGQRARYNLATIRNCIIAGNRQDGIHGGKPTIINSTIIENLGAGIDSAGGIVTSSIVFFNDGNGDNTQIRRATLHVAYSDVQGGWPGDGNLDADPQFIERGRWIDAPSRGRGGLATAIWAAGDYHLRSQGWRWDRRAGFWTSDSSTSPCIDTGDPDSPLLEEPMASPQLVEDETIVNERINMGAYGGTVEASLAPTAN